MKAITAFFKPIAPPAGSSSNSKRMVSGVVNDDGAAAGGKKPRLDEPETPPPATALAGTAASPLSPPLSPEQLQRIQENQRMAKERLLAKQQQPMASLESTTMGPSWLQVLQSELKKDSFRQLKAFLASEVASGRKVFPPENDIYSWSRLTPFHNVRVVILGQDPYHNDGQAHGLAFSVRKGVRIPPSLENMFKELSNSVPGFCTPKHGNLEGWARQGVLLLNSSLTVRAHEANSHAGKGWEDLTDAAIKHLSQERKHIIFMLWGSHAQKRGKNIDRRKHLVLEAVHPSPLSAHRGFFGCGHFVKANEYLAQHNLVTIDWSDLDSPDPVQPTTANPETSAPASQEKESPKPAEACDNQETTTTDQPPQAADDSATTMVKWI